MTFVLRSSIDFPLAFQAQCSSMSRIARPDPGETSSSLMFQEPKHYSDDLMASDWDRRSRSFQHICGSCGYHCGQRLYQRRFLSFGRGHSKCITYSSSYQVVTPIGTLIVGSESFIANIPFPAMPLKVVALPSELIQYALQAAGLLGQDILAILRAPDWHGLNSQNEQILFLFDFVGSNSGIGLSNQELARTFGITTHYMSKIHSKARKPQNKPHHPLKLDEAQEKSVL
jgi:hypothetical protein